MPKKSNNRDPRKDAKLERDAGDEPIQAGKGTAFTSLVDIYCDHYRIRLADQDNLCVKAVLDEIVRCGILRDDSAKEIREVRHRQHKVKNQEEERTVVRIEEISE